MLDLTTILQSEAAPAPQVEAPPVQEAVQTAPVVDSTAATAPVTEPVKQDFNPNEYIQKEFGTDEASLRRAYSEYGQLNTRLSEYESKIKTLEDGQYRTNTAKVFDQLLSKVDGDAAQTEFLKNALDLVRTDVTTLADVDAVRFQAKIDNPMLSDTEITTYINHKYGLGEFATDAEKEYGAINLKVDGAKSKAEIAKLKEQTMSDPTAANREKAKALESARVATWDKNIDQVVNKFDAIKATLDVGGEKVNIEFTPPKEVLSGMRDFLGNVAKSAGWEYNDANIAQLKEIQKAFFLKDNFESVLQHAATQLQSRQVKKEVGEYNNVTPRNDAAAPASKESRDEAIVRLLTRRN